VVQKVNQEVSDIRSPNFEWFSEIFCWHTEQ